MARLFGWADADQWEGIISDEVEEAEKWALGEVARGRVFAAPSALASVDEGAEDRALWLAVIVRAIDDACGKGMGGFRDAASGLVATSRARSWLTGNSDGFRAVCCAAGLDPVQVRSIAERRFAHLPAIKLRQGPRKTVLVPGKFRLMESAA